MKDSWSVRITEKREGRGRSFLVRGLSPVTGSAGGHPLHRSVPRGTKTCRSGGRGIDNRKYTAYDFIMIKTFRHKGLDQFFHAGSKAGIQPEHASRLRLQLTRLDASKCPDDMGAPGWKLYQLKGDLGKFWSVRVDGNRRMVFRFEGEHVFDVDYLDYH